MNNEGVYRDYCGYNCYVEKQRENRKITDWLMNNSL